MSHETDAERRQRELADSMEYAASSLRDPAVTRREAELSAEMAAGGLDPADEIRYEDMIARAPMGKRSPEAEQWLRALQEKYSTRESWENHPTVDEQLAEQFKHLDIRPDD